MNPFNVYRLIAETGIQDISEKAKVAADVGVKTAEKELSMFSRLISPEKLSSYLIGAIRVAVLIILLYVLWRICGYFIRRLMSKKTKHRNDETTRELTTAGHLLESILGYVMIFLGIMGVLSVFGFDMRGVVASAGVAGIMVAFISQSIIKDWINGLFILAERQYEVGQWVQLNEYRGEVIKVGMRSTTIRTWNNEIVYIPNGTIQVVVNLSKEPQRGILDLSVTYDTLNGEVEKVLHSLCSRMNVRYRHLLVEEINILGVQNLGNEGVIWRLTFTALDLEHVTILRDMRREVKEAFDLAGIKIPYPCITIYQGGGDIANETEHR